MYAVEFDTSIHLGIVHIPVEHKDLHEQQRARVLVMIDNLPNNKSAVTHAPASNLSANSIDVLDSLLENVHASLPSEIRSKSDDELRLGALRGRLL